MLIDNCPNISKLFLECNKLADLNFINNLDVEKLTILLINSGENELLPQNLSVFSKFKNLMHLGLNGTNFQGSLQPLKDCKRLSVLMIGNTNINSDLEYLPASCQKIYCNDNESEKGSEKIAKILSNYLKTDEQTYIQYYDFAKWKKDKKNATLSISLEKLHIIRSYIEIFRSKEKNSLDEIKTPTRLRVYKSVIRFPQWTGRVASVVGGSLLLVGQQQGNEYYQQTGGIIAIAAPFVEIVTSQLERKLYEENKTKREEFTKELEKLCDYCGELANISEETIKKYDENGLLSKKLSNLKEKVEEFFDKGHGESYDSDGNGVIDAEELDELLEDLKKNNGWEAKGNKLESIVGAIDILKNTVENYRAEVFYEVNNKEEKELLELENQGTELYQKIEQEVKEIKEEIRKEELEKQGNSLETKLKKAKSNYQQTQNQLTKEKENSNLLKEKGKLTDEKKKLLNNKIKELEQELSKLDKEIDNLKKEQYKNWWAKVKKILCCGKDKNEPSIKEQLSLENPEKQKELQEFIDNQEETKEDHQVIDLDKHFEEKENVLSTGSYSQSTSGFRKRTISNSKTETYELAELKSKEELQANIEIPPKS